MNLPTNRIHQILFEKIKLNSGTVLPDAMLMHLEGECFLDRIAQQTVSTFSTYIASNTRKVKRQDVFVDRTIEVPADWVEAFKERWFPKWVLCYFPVVYQYHDVNFTIISEIEQINVCPHIELPAGDRKHYEFLDFTMDDVYKSGEKVNEEIAQEKSGM